MVWFCCCRDADTALRNLLLTLALPLCTSKRHADIVEVGVTWAAAPLLLQYALILVYKPAAVCLALQRLIAVPGTSLACLPGLYAWRFSGLSTVCLGAGVPASM